MGLVLEVEHFTDLDDLSRDISGAVKSNPNIHIGQDRPMTVESPEVIHEEIRAALLANGSFEGLRKEDELMANVWNIGGVYTHFKIKKEK